MTLKARQRLAVQHRKKKRANVHQNLAALLRGLHGMCTRFFHPKNTATECCGSKRCENTLSRTGRLQCVRVRIRIASAVQQSSACFSPPQTLIKSNQKTLMRWRRGMKMEALSRSKRPSAHTTKKKQKAAFVRKMDGGATWQPLS